MIKLKPFLCWTARIVAALIMTQTLYYKFSGAEESVYIFTRVGMEPWGRIVIGVLELIASLLLILNATAWAGAVLALGLMAGAITLHLTILGISVRGDGGYLFFLSVVVAFCSVYILIENAAKIKSWAKSTRR